MQPQYYFFLIFLITLTITRILLSGRRVEGSGMIKYIHKHFHVHHFMYGLLLIILGVIFGNLTIYAIGSALFVDEIPLFLGEKWTWGGYYSKGSLIILLVLILIIFVCSKYLLFVV